MAHQQLTGAGRDEKCDLCWWPVHVFCMTSLITCVLQKQQLQVSCGRRLAHLDRTETGINLCDDVNPSLEPGGATNAADHLNGEVPHGRRTAANLAHVSATGVAMVQTPVVSPTVTRYYCSFTGVIYFTLKMEAKISLETLLPFDQTTWRHNPTDSCINTGVLIRT
jgi:hypothetical protein